MPRKVNFREEIPGFLIVCEGKETDLLYTGSPPVVVQYIL